MLQEAVIDVETVPCAPVPPIARDTTHTWIDRYKIAVREGRGARVALLSSDFSTSKQIGAM